MKWVASPILTFLCFKAVLQLLIRLALNELKVSYEVKTGSVHSGQAQKFREKYILSHINCVSQALQGRRVSDSAPLSRNRFANSE